MLLTVSQSTEVKEENKWEFVDSKLTMSFCFTFVEPFLEVSDSLPF